MDHTERNFNLQICSEQTYKVLFAAVISREQTSCSRHDTHFKLLDQQTADQLNQPGRIQNHSAESLQRLPRIPLVPTCTQRKVSAGVFPTSINCTLGESRLSASSNPRERVIRSSRRWRPGRDDLPASMLTVCWNVAFWGFERPGGALKQAIQQSEREEMRAACRETDKWTVGRLSARTYGKAFKVT